MFCKRYVEVGVCCRPARRFALHLGGQKRRGLEQLPGCRRRKAITVSVTNGNRTVSDEIAAPAAADVWQWNESADATRTYSVFSAVLLLGLLPAVQESRIGDLFYFISLAVTTIYMGAHRGLNSKERQAVTLKQGVLAPVFASAALLTLYAITKYFPDLNLQTLLDIYFWLLACFATIGAFRAHEGFGKEIKSAVCDACQCARVPGCRRTGRRESDISSFVSDGYIVAVLGISLATLDMVSHHGNFTVNNTIACLIAADIMQLIGLSSFRVAGVLLIGMLLYDVTWVFASPAAIGENVMLKVATSDAVVGPTRLLFPRIPGSLGEASSFPFALLGLGDIAIPGLLCCLALRYDASRSIDMRARGIAAADAIIEAIGSLTGQESGDEVATLTGTAAEDAYDRIANLELEQQDRSQGLSSEKDTVFTVSDAVLQNRTYFVSVVIAYIVGLSAAFAANEVTGLGQPALLYLVPCTIGAIVLTALSRREVSRVWRFTDTRRK
eukprot:jgi/Picre1/30896/NNA_006255.t1